MKRITFCSLALGLLLALPGRAQVKTYFWTDKDQVAVTVDRSTGYAYAAGSKSPLIPTGNITVKPGPDADIRLLIELGGGDLDVVQTGRHGTYVLQPRRGQNVFDVANRIYESGRAQWAFPEFIIDVVPLQSDPLYANQYYLHNTGQNGGTAGMDINAPQAWLITTGVNKIKVAVIDTGVEPHEDLEAAPSAGGVSRVLPGYDPLDPTNPGLPTTSVGYRGHGESVSGIIGASHNATGVAGVAPCSDIVPVNIFGPGGNTTTSLADAIDWAWDQGGADVLSNSWGYGGCSGSLSFPDINQAILNARTLGRGGRGCPVVFASGNAGCSTVAYPANLPGVISVGALDRNGLLTGYSNFGPETDVVAFGGYGDIVTTDLMGPDGYDPGNYNFGFDGTSAACPQVSGTLALMLSVNPNLTEADVSALVQNTATFMGAASGTGPGPSTHSWNPTTGYGRVNVASAVVAAAPVGGPTQVTYGVSSTFSIPAQPAGTTISWSVTPSSAFRASYAPVCPDCNQNQNVSTTGQTFTFNPCAPACAIRYDEHHSGTITATLTGPCGTAVLTKAVMFGTSGYFAGVEARVAPSPSIAAYPNPVNQSLSLKFKTNAADQKTARRDVALVDAYGRTQFAASGVTADIAIDTSSFPEGLYLLQEKTAEGVSTQRIIVKH